MLVGVEASRDPRFAGSRGAVRVAVRVRGFGLAARLLARLRLPWPSAHLRRRWRWSRRPADLDAAPVEGDVRWRPAEGGPWRRVGPRV